MDELFQKGLADAGLFPTLPLESVRTIAEAEQQAYRKLLIDSSEYSRGGVLWGTSAEQTRICVSRMRDMLVGYAAERFRTVGREYAREAPETAVYGHVLTDQARTMGRVAQELFQYWCDHGRLPTAETSATAMDQAAVPCSRVEIEQFERLVEAYMHEECGELQTSAVQFLGTKIEVTANGCRDAAATAGPAPTETVAESGRVLAHLNSGRTLGERLRLASKACGLSGDDVADQLNTSKSLIMKHWNDQTRPNPSTLKKYADVFSSILGWTITPIDLDPEPAGGGTPPGSATPTKTAD